jgi:diguanylate cyclase (GGDEF)-like protein/PAS domain S-box-containing protein
MRFGMNPGKSIFPGGSTDEISSLIEVLHVTEQRLQELTAGEVDTVADRDGRTITMRRAQDHLRQSAASRQAAILDSLPALIALLDDQGLIVSMNEAWRHFSCANVLQGPNYEVGLNYLATCKSAPGGTASEAHQVAEGIRSVLAGETKSFSIEYHCHSSTEERWFVLMVTPLVDDQHRGVVVMHLDVTAKTQAEHNLRAMRSRFRQLAENVSDVFVLQSLDGSQIHYVSPAYEKISGRSCESLYANPWSWTDSIYPDDRNRVLAEIRAGRNSGFDIEHRFIRADGEMRWIQTRGFPVPDDAGNPYRIAGVISDITERKQAQFRIERQSRMYAMLSGISTLIVRAGNRDELFVEACRVAVDLGQFKAASIGVVDRETMEIRPVASAGSAEEFIVALRPRFSLKEDAPEGRGALAQAIFGKEAVVINDVAHDPRILRKNECIEFGIASMVALPLLVSDDAVGVFVLLAGEAGFFDEEEMKLLTGLAGDIAFAIDHIEKGARLDYLAYYDVLTGLANRSLFLERAAQYMRSAANENQKMAVFLIDLERFKNINDSLGQTAGDALLKQVAEWLTGSVEDANLLARVGADHFAVVLPEVKNEGELARLLEKIIEAFLDHPFRLNDAEFRIAAKFGVALFPEDGGSADALFRHAEAALKKAKASGERYLFYTEKMTDMVAGKLTLENQLRQALDNEEFVLHYQPKVNLKNGKVTSAEALIRWNDPRTGLVPPFKFIPILEETGLIYEVGRWALHKAVDDYQRWRAAGLAAVRIAVNVSPLQLRNRGFVAEINKAIAVDAHAAAGLELEITESMIMDNIEQGITTLQAIRDMGITIAIDDFGTGFSSLGYLSKLPVDTLKIDRSFIIEMTQSPEGLALVSTMINLGQSLNLKIVAEGVETEEQSRVLRLLRCDEMQGYLFSKPVPCDIFEARFLATDQAATTG